MTTFDFVRPFLTTPLVAADALTVGVVASETLAPAEMRFRVYVDGTSPPAGDWLVREFPNKTSFAYEYFTWDGLEEGVRYRLDAVLAFDDLTYPELSVTDTVLWTPAQGLFPPEDTTFPVDPKPWAWEDYAGQWLALLAWYHRSDPLAAALFTRLRQEFQRLAAATETFMRWSTPSRAFDYGLEIHESALGIRPPSSLSEARRRALVLAHLRGRADPSASNFTQSLRFILDDEAPRVREYFNDFLVQVNTGGSADIAAIASEVVERILPAHLEVEFGSLAFTLDYEERRGAIVGAWPRGRATQRPDGFAPSAGFDYGEFLT